MNCCCRKNRGPGRRVELVMLKDQLMYDIKNVAFVQGDTMNREAEHVRHQVQDVGEDGNVDWVARQLDLAHGMILNLLQKLTPQSVHSTMDDDEMDYDQEDYHYSLLLPAYMKQVKVKYLKELIHNLMVAWVLQEWMSITHSEDYEMWAVKAASLEKQLKDTIDANSSVTRIRPSNI